MPFLQLITRMNLSRPWLWSRILLILSSSPCYHLGKSKWTCNVTVAPNSTQQTVMISYTLEANRWLLGGERGLKSLQLQQLKYKHDIRLSIVTAGAGVGGLRNLIPGLQRVLNLSFDTFTHAKILAPAPLLRKVRFNVGETPKDLSVRLLTWTLAPWVEVTMFKTPEGYLIYLVRVVVLLELPSIINKNTKFILCDTK